ncbi:lipoprotein LpqH [Mycobacterium sp. URHB0021]|jgi:ipoprotein LpqH
METRLVVVASVVLMAAVAGCSTEPSALGGTTAKVTIDGKSTGGAHVVKCSQTGWDWTIATPDKGNGFTAVVQTGDTVTAERVDFRDLGGFTGSFWSKNIGEAEVSGVNGKYTITGSADGSYTDNPSKAVTATFRIEASC